MKSFLYKILLFLLPAWCVLTICDYFFSEMVKKSSYFHILNWYDLMHGKIDANAVIMGNSRAWVQIDPVILDSILGWNTYNLGLDASPINRQVKKYNLFSVYNKRPQLIIQNIDFSSLGYSVGYEREQFFPYFWEKPMRDELFPSEPFSIWEEYVPMYRYYHNFTLGILYCVLTNTSNSLSKGYQGQEKQWDGTGYKNVKTIKFASNDTTLMIFDKYLAARKAEGVKVIFVYSPLYIGATKKIENLQEMRNTYQQYADKYEIPVLDYTYMNICYDTAYFFNAMHLNKTGAEIFSDTLANDIKRLGIINGILE